MLDALAPSDLLGLARASLAAFTKRDLTRLTEGEVLEAAQQATEVAMLAGSAQVLAGGRLDTSKAWQTSGAKSAGSWLAWQCRVPVAGPTAWCAAPASCATCPPPRRPSWPGT